MKRKLLLALLLAALVVALAATASAGEKTFADMFPDDNFRAYVTETVLADSTDPKGDTDIPTKEQMNQIKDYTGIMNIARSDISSLEGISYFSSLSYLNCNSNQLTKLDVSQNTALMFLWCDCNQLTELDISQNPALTYLSCNANQLTELDVSQNLALETLYCHSNHLRRLNISQNSALTNLYCNSNLLTELDVSQNAALTDLYCYFNQLTELDVSQNTELTSLCCHSNQLTELDVSRNSALTNLFCYSNQLTELDLSMNMNLKQSSTGASSQAILHTDAAVSTIGAKYSLNLWTLVPGLDLTRVTMNDGCTLNTTTGIVTYTEKPETISYLYQTNSPSSDTMEVTWTPVFAEVSLLPGDLDGDGVLSSSDLILLSKHLLGTVTLTGEQQVLADLNDDRLITAADAVLLAKRLLS